MPNTEALEKAAIAMLRAQYGDSHPDISERHIAIVRAAILAFLTDPSDKMVAVMVRAILKSGGSFENQMRAALRALRDMIGGK